MGRNCYAIWLALALSMPSLSAADERVVLPLSLWNQVQDALQPGAPAKPWVAWCGLDRTVTGVVRDGLFEATLNARFEVFETVGWLDVPLLDADASLVSVEVDGAPASLRREGEFYVFGVAEPGVYQARIRFVMGRSGDRFEESLTVGLPDAGPAHLSIHLPAVDVKATLEGGVLTGQRLKDKGTLIEGEINGAIQLKWSPNREPAAGAAQLSVRQRTLFTVQPALVSGLAELELQVEAGEVDRLALVVPAGLEVVAVTGDEVLQWRTEPAVDPTQPGRLAILLTHLITEDFRIGLKFQSPIAEPTVAWLQAPTLAAPSKTRGHIAVLAATGLEIEVGATDGASPAGRGSLPTDLTEMTTHPVLLGFSHTVVPRIELRLSHNAAVRVAGTIVDDLEASTLLLGDGTEITKARLFMRNNARQYLGLELPEGAELTHALIDGEPVTLAVETVGDQERLLVPLRQSMQVQGGRFHLVQLGENLGAIAYIYYSNPDKWPLIVEANDVLGGPEDVQTGQRLRIPAQKGVEVEESRFVFEFAWRRQRDPLGSWGQRRLTLPDLDVDVVKATWHVYLPRGLEPMQFESNFVQYSAIRYDPFRRFGMFVAQALVGKAEAGGVLEKRRALFVADAETPDDARMLGAFPVVGQKYRFKRLLLGTETPTVSVRYVSRSAAQGLQWLVLMIAALLVFVTLRPGSGPLSAVFGLVLLVPMLVAGHSVNGVHRHLVWGFNLGLCLLLLRHHGGAVAGLFTRILGRPTTARELVHVRVLVPLLVSWCVLLIFATYPLLLPLALLVPLTLGWLTLRQTTEVPSV